jgi:hypothetical protein
MNRTTATWKATRAAVDAALTAVIGPCSLAEDGIADPRHIEQGPK